MWRAKRPSISNVIFKEKSKDEGLTPPTWRFTVKLQLSRKCGINERISTDYTENKAQKWTYINVVSHLWQKSKGNTLEKRDSWTNDAGTDTYFKKRRKKNLNLDLTPFTKITSK